MTEAVSRPTPVELSQGGDFETLERVWIDEMSTPGELDRYLVALQSLVDLGESERAGILAGMLAEALDAAGRQDDVLPLLEQLAAAGVTNVSGVDEVCTKALQATYGKEAWFDYLAGKAGVSRDAISWDGFLAFQECARYRPGEVVIHGAGWGVGVVAEIIPEDDEVVIDFASGKLHRVPWQSALDTMAPLPVWDLRAMHLKDPEGLVTFAKANPVEVLRRTLKVHRGRANATQLKDFLNGLVVPKKSWASWWKKAKAAAIEDPLIAVEGSATRPMLTLRQRRLTLCEEARESLSHERETLRTVTELRSYIERATRQSDTDELCGFARERLGGLAASSRADVESLLAALFLEDLGQVPTDAVHDLARRYLHIDAAGSELAVASLAAIPDKKLRARLATKLPEIIGEEWHLRVAPRLADLDEDCEETLEVLVDKLRERKDPAALVTVFQSVAPFPKRHPLLIYLLTKAYADGDLGEGESALDADMVCRVIMHVLRLVSSHKRGAWRTRLQSKIVTVLVGKRGILRDLLESIDPKTLEAMLKIARGGGEDFPSRVHEPIEQVARKRCPALFEDSEQPFWAEDDIVWSGRAGLDKRQADFQHLRDVLIPANSKAIGVAASHGDLSENSEWEAAIEEQRTLTARAAEWESELKRVRLIEDCHIPTGVVAPGTRVRLLEIGADAEKTMRILGPWDSVLGEDVVSYRAPLAAGLLGHHVEAVVDVELPGGSTRFQVLEVEPLFETG